MVKIAVLCLFLYVAYLQAERLNKDQLKTLSDANLKRGMGGSPAEFEKVACETFGEDGYIEENDFIKTVRALIGNMGTEEFYRNMFHEIDKNHNGKVNNEEFISGMWV